MLKRIKSIFLTLFILSAVFLGAWFVVHNNQVVDVEIFGFFLRQQTLGLLLLLAFVLGLLLGISSSFVLTTWMSLKIVRLQKKLHKVAESTAAAPTRSFEKKS